MGSTAPTLFVVDPEDSARSSIAAIAIAAGIPVETFSSGEEFLQQSTGDHPGCAIVEWRLPGMDGLQVQERLCRSSHLVPTILTGVCLTVPLIVRAMRQGVFDVVEKPWHSEQLLQVIQTALRFDHGARTEQLRIAECRHRIDSLDPRERRAAELISYGAPNKSIARDLGVSQRTVDRIRASVLEKLGVHSAVELVRILSSLSPRLPPASNASDAYF